MRHLELLGAVVVLAALTGGRSEQDKPQAPPMTPRAPFNVGLSVADAEKTSRWYEQNLGLVRKKTATFPKGKAIILGPADSNSGPLEIEIIQHSDAVDPRSRLNVHDDYLMHGIFKFGFYVEHLDETVARLKQRKIKFYYENGFDKELGLRFAIIADEDGNTIQLFEKPASKSDSRR